MIVRLLQVLTLALALSSCQDKGKVVSEEDLSSGGLPSASDYLEFYVLPGTTSLSAGRTVNFSVLGMLPYGNTRVVTTQGVWSVADAALLETVPSIPGRVRALAPGQAQVNFTFGSVVVQGSIIVSPKTLDQMKLSDDMTIDTENVDGSLSARTFSIVATGLYSDGSAEDLSKDVDWVCPDSSIVSCNGDGTFNALGLGSTTITARVGTLERSVTVDVTTHDRTFTEFTLNPTQLVLQKDTPQPLKLMARFSNGQSIDVTGEASFTLSDPSLVTITGTTSKVITARIVNSGLLTVTWQGQSKSYPIRVVDPLGMTLAIESPTKNFLMAKGEKEQFIARLHYSDGRAEDVSSMVSYLSGDVAVLFQTSGTGYGNFQVSKAGTTSLTAKFGPLTAVHDVTVTAAKLTAIAITSVDSGTLGLNLSRTLLATGTFSDATTRNITTTGVWSIQTTGGMGSFTAPGVFHGTGVGALNLVITQAGMSQTYPIVVGPAVPVEILVYPKPATGSVYQVALGSAPLALTAMVRYSDSPDDVPVWVNKTSEVTWTYIIVGDVLSFCGYVSPTGYFTNLSVGKMRAVAKLGNVSGNQKIEVLP